MAQLSPKKIVISRTDSIGDVVLTLPMAGILKEKFPNVQVVFLGKSYTRPIIECCEHVDEVWEWDVIEQLSYDDQLKWLLEKEADVFIHVFPRSEIARLAKKAGVNMRIGTAHRAFHLLSCNKLVNFTRKRSELHEAQLNIKLLAPLGIRKTFSLQELSDRVGFNRLPELPERIAALIDPSKEAIIMHPKSQGSAREWPVKNYVKLAKILDPKKYQIFFTGTEKEAESFRKKIPKQENIVDLSGKMTLSELIAFIVHVDHLIAASTGPLHVAGVCGIHAIGLFTDVKPIHPGRWQPLGKQVFIIKSEKNTDLTQPLRVDVRVVERAIENRTA